MLIYKLFGGNVSSGRVPGDSANMFNYSGPRGLKVPISTRILEFMFLRAYAGFDTYPTTLYVV